MGSADVSATSARREPVASDVPDLHSTSERTIMDLRGAGPFVNLGRYRYLAAHDPLPVQLHERLFVIACAVRSRFDFVVNDEVLVVEPGAVIFIPPGNRYTTGIDAQSRGELTWLGLTSTEDAPSALSENSALRRVVDDLSVRGVRTCPCPQLTIDLLSRVLTTAEESWDGSDTWREMLCAAALLELWRATRAADHLLDALHPGLRRATSWAQSHIESPIAASDLIRESGMSSTRFYELFAESFGTTPKDYILRMKIDRATEMLRMSATSITDISHTLGFSSSQHFGTTFRRYVGVSPSEYRTRTKAS